jgi:hypothetical protein
MRFESKTTNFRDGWRYQAQFQSQRDRIEAEEWIAARHSSGWSSQHINLFTSDLQIIFELRLFFEHSLKVIRRVDVPQSGKS